MSVSEQNIAVTWRHRSAGILLAIAGVTLLGATSGDMSKPSPIGILTCCIVLFGAFFAFSGSRWRLVRRINIAAMCFPFLSLPYAVSSEFPIEIILTAAISFSSALLGFLLLKSDEFPDNAEEIVRREIRGIAWLIIVFEALSIINIALLNITFTASLVTLRFIGIRVVRVIPAIAILKRRNWGRWLYAVSFPIVFGLGFVGLPMTRAYIIGSLPSLVIYLSFIVITMRKSASSYFETAKTPAEK